MNQKNIFIYKTATLLTFTCQIFSELVHYMKSEPGEKILIESVLLKDRAAFEKLIRQYEGLVIHIVGPLISNEKDREDICQDVFLKVYEKLHTFQFRSKLSTWIGNIAYNTSINYLQKKKNILLDDIFKSNNDNDSATYENFISKNETQSPERLLIQKEESRLLAAAVSKLPVIQKTLLLLFHNDELSIDEISLVVEMPVNTVKSHLFRARISLKEMLLQYKN
jgi:RNA polymerase sigma factor (sigma-70 family)